jgi:SAM-dependent methyltransferase
MPENLVDVVTEYYTAKLNQYGPSAKGVDWPNEESQRIRFEQLSKVISDPRGSVLDYGCGYSALYDFLLAKDWCSTYVGYDWSERMLDAARAKHAETPSFSLISGEDCKVTANYVIASGIFNVKLGIEEIAWRPYVFETIDKLNELSDKGFAFNCLTSYSDKEKQRVDLFYANPLELFDYCKTNFSQNVALLHDYGLYEFTIIVRK